MVLQFYFTFKPFPSHTQKRERARERKSSATKIERSSKASIAPQGKPSSPRSSKASIAEIIRWDRQDRPPRSLRLHEAPRRLRSRLRADHDCVKCRSRSRKPLITIARSTAPIATPRQTQKIFVFLYLIGMFVFLCLFVFLLFGNRENVKKCDWIWWFFF